jgi:hypothetical protein
MGAVPSITDRPRQRAAGFARTRLPSEAATMNAAEYREQAEECRRNATRAVRQRDKAEWLRLAEEWLRMAEEVEGSRAKNR